MSTYLRIKNYRTKTYLDGYELGPTLKGKTLIAIPEAKLPCPSELLVIYIQSLDGVMYLRHSDIPKMVTALSFRDKWGRGVYKLCYFEINLACQQYYFSWGGANKLKVR